MFDWRAPGHGGLDRIFYRCLSTFHQKVKSPGGAKLDRYHVKNVAPLSGVTANFLFPAAFLLNISSTNRAMHWRHSGLVM
jgi:hypothetical protein